MKKFRTKPRQGKAKEASKSALLPKQAARMMKEAYIKQLDQRPKGAEDSPHQTPGQVERAGRWASDELAGQAMELGRKYAKRKFAAGRVEARSGPKAVPHEGNNLPVEGTPGERPAPEAPASTPRERPAAERPRTAPKERPMADRTSTPIKDRQTVERGSAAPEHRQPGAGRQPQRGGCARTDRPTAQAVPRRDTGAAAKATARNHRPEAVPLKTRSRQMIRERPRFGLRGSEVSASSGSHSGGKASRPAKAPLPSKLRREAVKSAARPAARSAGSAARAAKAAKRQMQRRMLTQTRQTVKGAAGLFRRAIQVVAKAAAAVTGAVSAVVGGCVLLVALVVIIVIAAVVSSPFGLFFAQEPTALDAVSVSQAVGSVNIAYNTKLEQLQAGGYDHIDIQGTAPDWPDVLAVFAVKVAGADAGGMDVATLDADRVGKLTAVFWDMTALASTVETIYHPDSNPDDDVDDSWTERILHITITPKTADDMRAAYGFTTYQNSALDELLSDRATLSALAGSLTITSADVLDILRSLPDDLSPQRRAVVEKVLSLVGKVNYFWGGKSYVIGWDSRWGTLQKVTSPGSSTSGTYRPYGLDCSGFLDWALRNAGLHSDGHWYIGRNLTAVSLADALPGDFALYPDASHVGMVVGWNAAGKLLVCHCSSGMNNVVVTEFSASGFTAVGRQALVPG